MDIKLRNFVIDPQTEGLYIIDFDIAKRLDSKEAKLTGFRGTKRYAAPEVDRGEPYDPFRADMWSVGVVIRDMLEVQSKLIFLRGLLIAFLLLVV
jgi:testis-specific serine kinase